MNKIYYTPEKEPGKRETVEWNEKKNGENEYKSTE